MVRAIFWRCVEACVCRLNKTMSPGLNCPRLHYQQLALGNSKLFGIKA